MNSRAGNTLLLAHALCYGPKNKDLTSERDTCGYEGYFVLLTEVRPYSQAETLLYVLQLDTTGVFRVGESPFEGPEHPFPESVLADFFGRKLAL